MVSAELIHNPYLLLTTVKFNGQAPRINSQIEKYEDKPLKDWVQMIPNIFYNEMNGYDFDLYFTGTNSDFKEIKQIFESVGVSSEQVRLIHKNELEDVETKSAEIDALLSWLRMHPNRKFDYYNFLEKYAEVFEGSYPCIFIRGIIADEMPDFVSPEVVSSVKELEHTNLTNIPIIFYVEDATSIEFRKDLHMLLNRLDIRKEQIFFLTHAMLDNNQVSRTISDLGVEVPQVIETCNDVSVITYFKHYPITEYVRSAIHVFSSLTNQIGIILEEEHKKSEIINTEIHKELDLLEIELLSLKHANNFFVQRDNYVAPQVFQEYRQTLLEQIQKWKNKKIKIVGDSEIEMAATDYIVTLQKNMRSFFVAMSTTYKKEGESINNPELFMKIYLSSYNSIFDFRTIKHVM